MSFLPINQLWDFSLLGFSNEIVKMTIQDMYLVIFIMINVSIRGRVANSCVRIAISNCSLSGNVADSSLSYEMYSFVEIETSIMDSVVMRPSLSRSTICFHISALFDFWKTSKWWFDELKYVFVLCKKFKVVTPNNGHSFILRFRLAKHFAKYQYKF